MKTLEETKEKIAMRLMQEIMYCNGAVNRWEPERYPSEWVKKISIPAHTFFSLHPQLYNDDDIENICDGEEGEITTLYGHLEGYKDLNKVLNEYFDNM